ncbi:type I methionyl aminopeptidase [Streptomyces cinnamoneus]|uniref:Methionine aminopeptidase n=2 Tax=Streptomyces cinnamoneus TaxID=53446 RepID=A0A2G1XKT0_STRCJ|nr:type I methionyl aminopeptidase [Streptomyces cinnamoneus]PHQ51826.1 type I methionyl aminopeptidase [Streptomyces cinnamoneus]PPT12073.1 type I methionyl aminopeptidase [Streptomyces cinnamoneus]
MITLMSSTELETMREAGRVVAKALDTVRQKAAVGVSLLELDEIAAAVIDDAGATSSFRGYHPGHAPTPYPGVICSSVNDAVVHGIPNGYRLQDGDLVSIDCGASVDGLHGDSAVSFVVGEARPDDLELVDTTERALRAGIDALQPGARMGDVSHAIGVIGRAAGYGLLENHGGHGVGRAMHQDPFVPNEGRAGRGMRLRPGLVLALEPMFLAGGRDGYRVAGDGWTLRTLDGSRAAHAEHTVAVTEDGPLMLTAP